MKPGDPTDRAKYAWARSAGGSDPALLTESAVLYPVALSLQVLCTLFLDQSKRAKESLVPESSKFSRLSVKPHKVNCRSVVLHFAGHLEPRLGL
jgi:hypothetical protein